VALMLSLTFTTTVLADDAPPPPVTEETVVVPPEDQPVAEEVVEPVLETLPENTDLVIVVDQQVVPLASVDASTAIVVGDPIWCPAGVSPTPNANGCTDSYATLEDLIDDIDNSAISEPNQDGTIWIMDGADASLNDIIIDGSIFTTWSNYELTLQGGWDGTSTGTVSGSSSFSITLSIINWLNDIGITDISIENTDATGLEINTDGDIVLNNFTADDNQGAGAELYATGDITLTGDNSFTNNADTGLYADAGNDLTANNVTAEDNGGYGAELYANGDINLEGDNVLSGNADSGVYAEAGGEVNAENVSASDNGGNGASLNATGNVSVTGANEFSNNGDSGLTVDSSANVELENIEASGNSGLGLEVNAQGTVTLDGATVVNNDGSGLYIDAGGHIVMLDITADGNGGNGAELITPGNVSVTGTNSFNTNAFTGLYIEAGGDVTLANIIANGNGALSGLGGGVEVYSGGQVNMTGSNTLNNNYLDGLYIDAVGNIYLLQLSVSGNGTSGVFLESLAGAQIECSVFANNTGPEIEADLAGILTLLGVDFGGDIDNEIAADEDFLVLVSNQCFTYPDPVDETEDSDDEDGADQGDEGDEFDDSDDLPVHYVEGNAQDIRLDCEFFSGTQVTLKNGDGAFIPCPVEDTARLIDLAGSPLPLQLPDGYQYLSGYLLTIVKAGEPLGPLTYPTSLWYATPEDIQGGSVQAFYWDGSGWVELTDDITPFMRLFFHIPRGTPTADLAILYWDGVKWIEITEAGHLGNGYLVKNGGYVSKDGLYFEAILNFTGTFVLVQK
jgi:hypothetical protein